MVDNILTLLEIAKEKQIKGVHIDIALGRYKMIVTGKQF